MGADYVHASMKSAQKKDYISCQGESGSCAFGASRVHYYEYEAAPQPSFEDVIRRVAERDAKRGIIPIENSRSGIISEPVMLLARHDAIVVAEHHQPIRHHLMVPRAWVEATAGKEVCDLLEQNAIPPTQREQLMRALLSQVTAVYSDEQGFRQCDRGLKTKVAGAERRLTSCTAKAARIIAHEADSAKLGKSEIPAYAAIASEECVTMYRNVRLVSDLNDDSLNMTRYVTISREEPSAAQLFTDLDVKTILWELGADLDRLFENGELATLLEKAREQHGLMESDANSSQPGQTRKAEARILRDYLADKGPGVVKQIAPPGPISRKLDDIAKNIRLHSDKGEEALKRLLRDQKYQSRMRSVFIIRSSDPKVTLAEIVGSFYGRDRAKKNDPFALRVIAELPNPPDSKDGGLGIIAEANGTLLGAGERFKKKKNASGSFHPNGAAATPLEQVLRTIARKLPKSEIRILGTFAKEPTRFGHEVLVGAKIDAAPTLGDLRPERRTMFGSIAPRRAVHGVVAGVVVLAAIAAFLFQGL